MPSPLATPELAGQLLVRLHDGSHERILFQATWGLWNLRALSSKHSSRYVQQPSLLPVGLFQHFHKTVPVSIQPLLMDCLWHVCAPGGFALTNSPEAVFLRLLPYAQTHTNRKFCMQPSCLHRHACMRVGLSFRYHGHGLRPLPGMRLKAYRPWTPHPDPRGSQHPRPVILAHQNKAQLWPSIEPSDLCWPPVLNTHIHRKPHP